MQTTEPIKEHTEARRRAMSLVQALSSESAPLTPALIDAIILDAYASGASDIHILPCRSSISISLRIDGRLEKAYTLPSSVHAELIARLKILSGIRTDEHLIAHDGRFSFTASDEQALDVRISIAPTFYGENAVLRILSPEGRSKTLHELGMSSKDVDMLAAAVSQPHGLILATGATGSGKTTTLYALTELLADTQRSIVTIEDPIEYSIDGASQMAVNPHSGFTFANGLRSILRQDPDVILVGEIRDTETAQLACTAALTGHLVLSTMHARDVPTAFARLRGLGIEEYLITASLSMVIAQRLVPRICVECSTAGCAHCAGRGYRGRYGVYDVQPITPH